MALSAGGEANPSIRTETQRLMDLREQVRAQWVESVEDWIGQDQSVRTDMLDSWMLDALGDITGRRVLDIGCGEGRFCRLLAGMGAEVTDVDLTEGLVEAARGLSNGVGNYIVGNAEDLAGLDDETFELAVSYVVMVDIFDYVSSIKAAYRVLRPGGRFIVCNLRPIRMCQPTGWIKQGEKKLFYPVDDYMYEGPREWTWWGRPFVNVHRALSSYVSAFLESGFVLEDISEPTPSPEQLAAHPEWEDEYRAPSFIIYELTKPA